MEINEDITYLVDIGELDKKLSKEHFWIIDRANTQYQEFLKSGLSEKNYDREIKVLTTNLKQVSPFIDKEFIEHELRLKIPKSPTAIKKELLDQLIISGYTKDSYSKILEYILETGANTPRGHKTPPKKTSDGKTIQYFTVVQTID